MENRSSRFLNYMLTNKKLTREQRKEISRLLMRDLSNDIEQKIDATSENTNSEGILKAKQHDVKPVFDFLHLFTEKEALKYTTHDWDKSPNGSGYCFANYAEFKQRYTAIIEKHNIFKYSKELWELTKNFLFNDDGTYYWGRQKIKIGYNKFVQQWMEEHPDEQPMNMPMSAFPSSLRPGLIDNRSLSSFRDVVDIFKHCIEFREEDLYDMIMDVFDRNGLRVNMEEISISFYTCTDKIKDALEKIAENAFNRGKKHPCIEINFFIQKGDMRDTYVLEILQVDSFPDKPITHKKVLGKDHDGAIHQITELLLNLCDFSVESRFLDNNNQLKTYHINYLVSEKDIPLYYEMPSDTCRGYKSILKFYSYNDEKGNNNRR